MTDDQFDQLIALLEEIRDKLSFIETNTMDIASVESHASDTAEYLKKIENDLR